MVIPWKESWHKKMWPTLKSAIDFSRSPLLCVVKMALPKKYRNYQTNEFIWQLHIGDFFFMSKYKSLMTLMMSFSFANDKYTRFFFNFMNMNKKWSFELQMYNVQITQSNISVMYHNFHLWTPHQISLTMIKQLHV